MNSEKPWEIHPSLTEEKICHLATILKDVRDKTLELYRPEDGDGVWSLGCRIYERTINTIHNKSKTINWLGTIRNGLYFVILIDGVPIRYYKGDVDNPTQRSLNRKYPELEAQQFVFKFYEPKWFWRLVVETDEDGGTLRIVIVQFTESGDFQNLWEVPIHEPVRVAKSPSLKYRESVKLDKPPVKPRHKSSIGVKSDKNV